MMNNGYISFIYEISIMTSNVNLAELVKAADSSPAGETRVRSNRTVDTFFV